MTVRADKIEKRIEFVKSELEQKISDLESRCGCKAAENRSYGVEVTTTTPERSYGEETTTTTTERSYGEEATTTTTTERSYGEETTTTERSYGEQTTERAYK